MAIIEDLSARINEQNTQAKLIALALVVIVVSAAYWYFMWQPNSEEIRKLKTKLVQTENQVKEYEAIAAELPKFKEEFERLNREFEIVAAKLPKEKDIPPLIDSIYSEISASNLDSVIFAPRGQIQKEIYAEIPIDMEVVGTYYSLADFFDRLSRLPRIVNVRDLTLKRNDIRSGKVMLNAKFNVVTFRLLPAPPPAQNAPDKKKSGSKK